MSEPITVLLVDDHALVRQGVRAFLQTQGDISVVAEAESGETMASAPVLITYASGTPAPGLNGSADASFRDAGWDVRGIELDARACEVARRRYGLDVHEGTLEGGSRCA